MQIQRVIEKLGLSTKEAAVYLASLSLGESHISNIADKVKLPRTSTQVIVDKLHRENLMSFYIRHRYKYWMAEDPAKLLSRLKEQELELEAIIPKLRDLKHNREDRPSVQIFKGAEDIKHIHDDIIATKQSILAILPWDEWLEFLGYDYIKSFRERRANHFLSLDLMVPKTEQSQRLRTKDSQELRRTRFLPDYIRINTAIFIFGTKLAIISLNKKESTGILIDEPGIANIEKILLEEIWDKSI